MLVRYNITNLINSKILLKDDTVLLNKTLFLNIGVKESNLICSNICTKCNKSYMHSYRGSMGQGGLNTALIMLM